MKTLFYLKSLIIVLVIASCLIGCNTESQDQLVSTSETVQDAQNLVISASETSTDLLTFPQGTQLTDNGNGVDFILPAGYAMVGTDGVGVISIGADGSVKCKCSTAKTCSPYTVPGRDQMGCSTPISDPCPTCTMEATKAGIAPITDLQIIHLAAGIQLVTTTEAFNALEPMALDESIFELSEVIDDIADLQDYVYTSQGSPVPSYISDPSSPRVIPQDHVMAPINFYGYKVYYPMPLSFIGSDGVNEMGSHFISGAAAAKCSCDSGSGCTETASSWGVTYCKDADKCNGCELSF